MGYYVEVPRNFDKAQQIADLYGGILANRPLTFADIPKGKALICVLRNPLFEAAGFCYDEREFNAFHDPNDRRPRSYVLLDWAKASELTGFNQPNRRM